MRYAILLLLMIPVMGFTHRHHHRPAVIPPTRYNDILKLTADTIYLESGGELNKGKLGVASVIWNLSGGAANIPHIILTPKKFSCWNGRKPSSYKSPHNKSYEYCLMVAKDLVDGTFVPPKIYEGAIAYHEKSVRPNWRFSLIKISQVGNHFFYRDKQWWLFPV